MFCSSLIGPVSGVKCKQSDVTLTGTVTGIQEVFKNIDHDIKKTHLFLLSGFVLLEYYYLIKNGISV